MNVIRMALTALVMMASHQVLAADLYCRVEPYDFKPDGVQDRDQGLLFASSFRSDCYDTETNILYVVRIDGVGVNLRQNVAADYGIQCLGLTRLEGTYLGAKVDVEAGLAAGLGVFTNIGRSCVVGKIGIGAGVSVVGASMKIDAWDPRVHGSHRFDAPVQRY